MVLTLGTEVPSTPADGLVNTIWVPSIKNIQKPTAAEIGAGTGTVGFLGRSYRQFTRSIRDEPWAFPTLPNRPCPRWPHRNA